MLWLAGWVLTGCCLECLMSVDVMVGRSVVELGENLRLFGFLEAECLRTIFFRE